MNKITIAILSILLIACAKEDTNIDGSVGSQNDTMDGVAKQSELRVIYCIDTWIGYPFFITNSECHCASSGGTCLPTVTIYPSALMSDFVDSVDNNEVDLFFVGNKYEPLFASVSNFRDYLNGLRDGTLGFTLFNNLQDDVVYAALHNKTDIITKTNIVAKAIIVIPFD